MLRVALLDRHPAVLAELRALLAHEPDVAVTSLLTAPALRRRLPDVRPHVVVLAHPDALAVCRELTRSAAAPAVILAAPRIEPSFTLAARAAGAAAVVSPAHGPLGTLATIRAAHAGEATLPLFRRSVYAHAIERLEDDDVPVLTMLLDGRQLAAIAAMLRIPPDELDVRVRRIVDRLHPVT